MCRNWNKECEILSIGATRTVEILTFWGQRSVLSLVELLNVTVSTLLKIHRKTTKAVLLSSQLLSMGTRQRPKPLRTTVLSWPVAEIHHSPPFWPMKTLPHQVSSRSAPQTISPLRQNTVKNELASVSEYKQITTQTGFQASTCSSLGLIGVLTTIRPYCLREGGCKRKMELRHLDQYGLIICCLMSQRDESQSSACWWVERTTIQLGYGPKEVWSKHSVWLISTNRGSQALFLHLTRRVCCLLKVALPWNGLGITRLTVNTKI